MSSIKKQSSYHSEITLDIVLKKWQGSLDLLSELMNVPAVLIMKYEDEYMNVFVSSNSKNNPYKKGDKKKWHGLYCETVIKTQKKLLIPNAKKDTEWNKNPDIKLGMISYLGFPINYPDNTPFGTICVLDNKENFYSDIYERLLLQYKEIIEQDLLLLHSLGNLPDKQTENYDLLLKERFISQETNKIYRRLFESSNAAIFIISADFYFIDCNNMASKLLERQKHEIIGTTPADITISPKYQTNGELSSELGRKYFSSAMEGNDLRFEWIHLKKDGTEFPVEVSLFGFMASNKKNFFTVWRDLTEVKRKENELKESEERFRTIFSMGTDGVLLHSTDVGVGITHCNEAAYKILGYESKEGIIGKSIIDISPDLQEKNVKTVDLAKIHLSDCVKDGQTRFEWIHLKKDGSPIWFDIVLTKITYQDKVYVHSLWRDITEVKKYQDELHKHQNHLEEIVKERTSKLQETLKTLKEAQFQLVQSEKMASLGTLTAGVAHEINNPLNYILGAYLGLDKYFNKQGSNVEPQIPILLNSIKIGVDKASNIVKGLDHFSRDNSKFDEKCDIHLILDNCLVMLNNQIKDKVIIKKDFFNDPIEIKGNVGRLHQLFINILNNAIHSIDDSGEIEIATKKNNKTIVIKITDNGSGIDKKHLSQIMDPFFTTKAPGKGTGLGLSIAYSIIREHNGMIDFESEINKGTIVTIKIPVKQ